jgi:hypothetical protein
MGSDVVLSIVTFVNSFEYDAKPQVNSTKETHNMKDGTKTKVCYSEVGENGAVKTYITSENAFNKLIKDATEAKEPLPTLVAQQTFGYKYAESVDEAVTLAGGSGIGEYENIDTFLGVFNYAASLRQDNAANDVLQGESFQPKDGVWDVSFAVAEKVERAKMTPQEKAIRELNKAGLNISAEQLLAALQLIQAQAATA